MGKYINAKKSILNRRHSLGGRACSRGLSHLLADQLVGLINSHFEVFVVLQDSVDLRDVQIDQHARDLGSLSALERVDKAENGSTDLLLVVRVLLNNTLDKWGAAHQVGFFHAGGLSLWLQLVLLEAAWHATHLVLLLHLLRHLLHGLLDTAHVHWLLTLTHRHWATLRAIVPVVTVVGRLVAEVLALLVAVLHGVAADSGEALLVAWSQFLKELLEHFNQDFRLVATLEGSLATVLLAEFHEVDFVLVLFVLELSDFLDLVVVDLERAGHELLALEFFLGLLGVVGSLEADKAVGVLALFLGEKSDTLNLSELAEEVFDVLVGAGVRNVLDEQVALLLGVLVLHGVSLNLLLTVSLVQELLDVHLLAINFFAIEVIDSSGGSLGSNFAVFLVLREVSDHGVGTHLVLGELEHANGSVFGEFHFGLLLIPIIGKVLGVNVVENTPKFTLVTRLVLDCANFIFAALFLETLGGGRRLLEADEAITARGVLGVERDLQRLDLSELLAEVVEPLGVVFVVLGNFGDEHVVVNESLLVGTVECVVEGQASATFAVVIEVAELLACFGEALVVRDVDDGGAEGSVKFSSDLGLNLEDIASFLLNDQSDLVGVGGLLGQVVQVKIVGSFGVTHLHFCVFCFL